MYYRMYTFLNCYTDMQTFYFFKNKTFSPGMHTLTRSIAHSNCDDDAIQKSTGFAVGARQFLEISCLVVWSAHGLVYHI